MQAFGFSYRLANKYLFIVMYGEKSATSKHCSAFFTFTKNIFSDLVQLHQQTLGGCYQAMNVTVKVFHDML